MTRRERIVVLLENYVDVVNGLRDRGSEGIHVPLMCRPWNKPRLGYPELERLRLLLRAEQPSLYRHLADTYLHAATRRVNQCPRCQGIAPTWQSVNFHKHGHHTVALVPRVIRVIPLDVMQVRVDEAIEWLDTNWREPGPFLPQELQPITKKEVAA